ncbi:hypothetical protein KFU94_02840 [Chloroflexi bacterium TSY]|nr:hypothetical protein [Chloroflexi bacterium TSY]
MDLLILQENNTGFDIAVIALDAAETMMLGTYSKSGYESTRFSTKNASSLNFSDQHSQRVPVIHLALAGVAVRIYSKSGCESRQILE